MEGTFMSYTVANPGGKSRPATVTAASALLYVVAATQLISIVVSLLSIGPIQDAVEEALTADSGIDADSVRAFTIAGVVIGVVISLIFAVGAAVLGMLVGKGKNPARIVTWVLGGIGVLCYSCSLAGSAVSSSMAGLGGSDADADLQRRIEDAIPGWVNAVSITTTIVSLLALLAVVILLALPASNDFFRKEEEVWVPPTWPQGGQPPAPPTQPPYPPAPPQQ